MYNWRHFDAPTKKYYNDRTKLELPWGHNRYLSLYLKANYPMIIYWEQLQKSATDPIKLPDYMAEPYFLGVQKVRSMSAYPSSFPYGAVFHHSVLDKFLGRLIPGWVDLGAAGGNGAVTIPMIVLSKSDSVNQNVGGANDTEVWWTWDGEVKKDTGFTHDTGENPERIQVDANGWYLIRFCGNAQQTGSARTTLQGIIKVNGGSTLRDGTVRDYSRGANYGNLSPGLETIMYLEDGDYIEVGTRVENTDGSYTINSNGAEIADEENKLIVMKVA